MSSGTNNKGVAVTNFPIEFRNAAFVNLCTDGGIEGAIWGVSSFTKSKLTVNVTKYDGSKEQSSWLCFFISIGI